MGLLIPRRRTYNINRKRLNFLRSEKVKRNIVLSQMYQNGGGGFSHKAPACATDLHCYFQCSEAFKKDVDLRIHLKLKHRNEDETELRRAFQAAEEEIALVKRSASTFQCALCPKKFNARGSFSGHIKNVHKKNWFEYLEQYGSCEVESAPFQ